jgi:effector-binding domain-containing protein
LFWQPFYLTKFLLVALAFCTSALTFANTESPFEIKTIEAMNYVFSTQTLQQDKSHQQGEKIAEETAFYIATKTDTLIDGSFTYVFDNVDAESLQQVQRIDANLGWPVKKPATHTSGYQQKELPKFKCLTLTHKGPSTEVIESWQKLYNEAKARGLQFTGHARAIIKLSSNTGYVISELQLGFK